MTSIAGEKARRALAACADSPAGLWLGYEGETRREAAAREVAAVALCVDCPVRSVCLEEALTWPAYIQFGVRGGMTAAARRKLLRTARRADAEALRAERRRLSVLLMATVVDVTDTESFPASLGGAA